MVKASGVAAARAANVLFRASRYRAGMEREPYPAESAHRRYPLKVGNHEMTAAHMYELLRVGPDVNVIGTWSNRFAQGRAAITSRRTGKGRVVYLGTYLTDEL